MVIIYTKNLKPEYWDCNLDVWLENFNPSEPSPSDCVWFVPGTVDQIEAQYWDM